MEKIRRHVEFAKCTLELSSPLDHDEDELDEDVEEALIFGAAPRRMTYSTRGHTGAVVVK